MSFSTQQQLDKNQTVYSNAPSQPAPPVPETKDMPPEAPVPETEDTPPKAVLAPLSSDDNPDTSSNAPSTLQHFDTPPIHQPLDESKEPQADAVSEEGQMVDDEQGGGQQPTKEDVAESEEQQEETEKFPDFDVEKVQNDKETASLLLDCLKGELLGHDAEISPSEVIRILKGLGETRLQMQQMKQESIRRTRKSFWITLSPITFFGHSGSSR
eukprot:scaffold54637_cov34-Attheya_sp.AAC.2